MTKFDLYPAIDLKNGGCVRLLRGEMDAATHYAQTPAEQAAQFAADGFENLHVVDLNGAFAGKSENTAAIKSIRAATTAKLQLGGGIRDMDAVNHWLDLGIDRLILGTAAVRDPDFVRAAAAAFPEKILVGIDCKDGRVAVQGWAEATDMLAVDLAKAFEGCGVAGIIVTDIDRDGAKTGVNVTLTGQLADAVSIPVIASGGIASVADITGLRAHKGVRPIAGTIIGRALYEGDIIAREAIEAAHG